MGDKVDVRDSIIIDGGTHVAILKTRVVPTRVGDGWGGQGV